MSRTGRCLCGAVNYSVSTPIESVAACHCGMCQRWAGGIHLGFEVPPDGVVFEGAESIATYTSSEWAERAFCRLCGAHLYDRLIGDGPARGTYSMHLGGLDQREGVLLTQEIYIDKKPDGYALAGDHTRMTEDEFLRSIGVAL
ncbi:MAG: GFA family protein [Pseudomonadota bacterium]